MSTDVIGEFEIGASQIAGLVDFDVLKTFALQYANSPRIVALAQLFSTYLNPGDLIDSFISDVLDLSTAQGYGLDVLGRIVGVTRDIYVANTLFFGFDEAGTASATPFNQGVFYSGGSYTGTYRLEDEPFRLIVKAKAAANLSDGSLLSLNNILRLLFIDRGNAYVVNNRDMTMVYKFDFPLTPVEQTIIYQSGILPAPAGVTVTVEIAS